MSEKKDEFKIIYPLVERNIVQRHRNKFWNEQSIQLDLPAFLGNCKFCQDKSVRKLATEYLMHPQDIEWNLEMEEKYSNVYKPSSPAYNKFIDSDGGHYSLRGNKSWRTIIQKSKTKFKRASDEYIYEDDLFDQEGSCGSGCNIFESLGI